MSRYPETNASFMLRRVRGINDEKESCHLECIIRCWLFNLPLDPGPDRRSLGTDEEVAIIDSGRGALLLFYFSSQVINMLHLLICSVMPRRLVYLLGSRVGRSSDRLSPRRDPS